jgi:hypothetical protein
MKSTYKDHFAAMGRTNDIAVLPSGKSAWFLLHYKSIIEDDGNVNLRLGKSKPILKSNM